MTIPTLPAAPQRTDTPAVFVPKADAWVAALPSWTDATNATAADVLNNQVLASSSALTAITQAAIASNAAASAAISAGATLWVSGTTYTIGQKVISPANTQTYVRKTNGAGATDPSLDNTNWNPAVYGIARYTTATVSTVLTNATIGYVTTNMTNIGQSITMPSALTLGVASPIAVVDNTKGLNPVGVRDSTGLLLTSVGAGGYLTLSLKDISTAAGIWGLEGDMLEPGLVTINTSFSATYIPTTAYPQNVSFDNDTSLHFAPLASNAGFAGFIVDNVGKVVSTPVLITSTTNALPKAVFKITSTTAIIFYGLASSNSCVVVTLTGSSPSYSLSVGTPQTASFDMSAQAWGGEDSVLAPRIAQLTPTLYVASYTDSSTSNTGALAVSVTGTSITIGAQVNVQTSASTAGSQWIVPLTSTTALMFYSNSTSTTNRSVVVTVTGTACSFGTPVDNPTTSTNLSNPWSYCQLTPTKFVVLVSQSNNAILRTVSVAGTAITYGAALTLTSGASQGTVNFSGNGATRFNPHLNAFSATTIFAWFTDNIYSTAVVITENAGVLTVAGTQAFGTWQSSASGSSSLVLTASPTEFVVLNNPVTTFSAKRLIPHSISNGNIASGNIAPFINEGDNSVVTLPGSFTKLSSGDYCVQSNTAGLSVFRSNGVNINKRGVIALSTNSIGATYGSVSPNRIVAIRTSQNTASASGGALTFLTITNVEIAA